MTVISPWSITLSTAHKIKPKLAGIASKTSTTCSSLSLPHPLLGCPPHTRGCGPRLNHRTTLILQTVLPSISMCLPCCPFWLHTPCGVAQNVSFKLFPNISRLTWGLPLCSHTPEAPHSFIPFSLHCSGYNDLYVVLSPHRVSASCASHCLEAETDLMPALLSGFGQRQMLEGLCTLYSPSWIPWYSWVLTNSS